MAEAKENVISILKANSFRWKDDSEACLTDIRQTSRYFAMLKKSQKFRRASYAIFGSLWLLMVAAEIAASKSVAISSLLSVIVIVTAWFWATYREVEFALLNMETGSCTRLFANKKNARYLALLWEILRTNERKFTEEVVLTRIIASTNQCINFLNQNFWNTDKLVKKLLEQ